MSLMESVESFEGRVHQAELFSDVFWMAELVDEGYSLVYQIDSEMPGEGLEYRDQVASLIDKLCDAISDSEE
jgi:hypothetical protein